jgi:acyl-CoA synthetase (AMP-forming)/AMP-acid ligase II
VRVVAQRRPSEEADPVAAVLEAHAAGDDLVVGTSGTTTSRREVVRSTASWWSSFDGYTQLSGVSAGARLWLPGPLAATMNLFAAVHARVTGAALVDRPDGATHACVTPAVLARRGNELPRGCRVVVAGDALSSARHAAFPHLEVVHYYGAAELSFVACGRHAGALRAFPGVDLRVVDGEIRVRSPYLARPGSGALRMVEGWATVGDLGRLEGDGLVVLGRPDTVVTAGATVVLAEVEAELASAAAAPYALVGVPHPDLGAVLAAVVTDAGDRDRLAGHARAHLAPAQRPRLWQVAAELPLTDAGKVDRAALAELFRSTR